MTLVLEFEVGPSFGGKNKGQMGYRYVCIYIYVYKNIYMDIDISNKLI